MKTTKQGLADKRYSETKQAHKVWRSLVPILLALAILIALFSLYKAPKPAQAPSSFIQSKVSHDLTQAELDQLNCLVNPVSCPKASPAPRRNDFMKGYVSYYSDAGCLDCRADRLTASGEKFDENLLTLAHNQIKLGTRVRITNLDNGKTVIAKVNDRGGFNRLGTHGRIADLSLATCQAIECKTDKSIIVIEKI